MTESRLIRLVMIHPLASIAGHNPIRLHLPMQPYLDLQARAIMQLATSPVQLTQDDPLNGNAAVWTSPCHLPMDKDVLVPVDTTILQVAQAGSKWVQRLLDFALK